MTGLDKQALLNLMAYPNEISDDALEDLNKVLQESPYFQLGHSLVAKAKHDKQTPDAHDSLTHAAIYAPNRSLLRGLFYEDLKIDPSVELSDSEKMGANSPTEDFQHNDQIKQTEDEVFQSEPVASVPENDPTYSDSNPEEEQVIESDEVYNELEENLKKLRESKNKFSEDEEDGDDKKKIADESINDPEEVFPEKKNNPEVAPILMDLVKDSQEENEPLIYGNSKQNELIDRFINSNWSGLLNANKKDLQEDEEDQSDLSTTSVNISDDVITENLAEIYRRQGKKEKSIEIYHKLIWKFPQKKAYFAEIIQNLKAE